MGNITIDGQTIEAVTIDGQEVKSITIDGSTVWEAIDPLVEAIVNETSALSMDDYKSYNIDEFFADTTAMQEVGRDENGFAEIRKQTRDGTNLVYWWVQEETAVLGLTDNDQDNSTVIENEFTADSTWRNFIAEWPSYNKSGDSNTNIAMTKVCNSDIVLDIIMDSSKGGSAFVASDLVQRSTEMKTKVFGESFSAEKCFDYPDMIEDVILADQELEKHDLLDDMRDGVLGEHAYVRAICYYPDDSDLKASDYDDLDDFFSDSGIHAAVTNFFKDLSGSGWKHIDIAYRTESTKRNKVIDLIEHNCDNMRKMYEQDKEAPRVKLCLAITGTDPGPYDQFTDLDDWSVFIDDPTTLAVLLFSRSVDFYGGEVFDDGFDYIDAKDIWNKGTFYGDAGIVSNSDCNGQDDAKVAFTMKEDYGWGITLNLRGAVWVFTVGYEELCDTCQIDIEPFADDADGHGLLLGPGDSRNCDAGELYISAKSENWTRELRVKVIESYDITDQKFILHLFNGQLDTP